MRQDLQILINDADNSVRNSEANDRYLLYYFNPTALIYSGLSGLLQDQVAPERHSAALVAAAQVRRPRTRLHAHG